MAWTYSAVLGDSHLPCKDGFDRSPTASWTPTSEAYCYLACGPATWLLRPYGTTLRLSPDYISQQWISFTVASHARTSALQALAEA